MGTIAAGADAESYRRFMLPGVLGMVILFSAMLAALTTALDREFGAIRLLLIAPVRRTTLVLGKIAGSTVVALVQAGILLLLLPVLAIDPEPQRLVLLVGAMTLTAAALSALGMVLASTIRSLETFSGIMNFVNFPMLFLSGALYPVRVLPSPLQAASQVNPLTYGIDLMKHALFGRDLGARYSAELPVAADVAVLVATFVLALGLAVALFDREARIRRLATATQPRGF